MSEIFYKNFCCPYVIILALDLVPYYLDMLQGHQSQEIRQIL